eukprot:TRINITY_DN112_c2_g2_i8.p1 TRINITY_DN112_c2_g2~~TRINITY_DN112_c2_g2_i8.p1  ORF type:complete len:957 (+),score=333.15 TRINITY_DN112_c2_g2_i8:93-2873(+)
MSRPRGQSGVGRAESPTGGSPSGRKLSLPGGGGGSGGSGVKVMVRVRPFNSREKELSREKGEPLRCIVEMNGKNCIVLDETNDYEPRDIPAFVFDECLWSLPEDEHNPMSPNGFANQHTVYEKGGAEALTNAWEGYNTCIFAYGQTGAGKSFSMLGSPELPGIAPQLITNLFKHVDKQKEECPELMFNVEVTFFEIYMEKVKDLFNKGKKDSEYSDVKIRQHPLWGIQVQGLETKAVKTEAECAAEMDYGVSQRSLASTKMNATSSRSHAIFQIHINQNNVKTKAKSTATINLVDLAGSERIGKTGATGATKEEGMAINLSLSTLRKVMDALVDLSKGKKVNPPYRESKLTWVLKESLGGNSKTVMITAISPHYDNIEDTVSTLRYGLKAKAIVNKAVKQETTGKKLEAEMRKTIQDLEEQLRIAQQSGGGGEGGLSEEQEAELQEQIQMTQAAVEQIQEEKKKVEERESELLYALDSQKKKTFAQAFRQAFAMKQHGAKLESAAVDMRKLEEEKLALDETHRREKKDWEGMEQELKGRIVEVCADAQRQQQDAREQFTKLLADVAEGNTGKVEPGESIAQISQRLGTLVSGMRKELVQERMHAQELAAQQRQLEEELERCRSEAANQARVAVERQQRAIQSAEAACAEADTRAREALQDRAELEAQLGELRAAYDALGRQMEDMQAAHAEEQREAEHTVMQDRKRCEEALLWSQQRKEHYKALAAHLREVHSADTRIIASLGRETCAALQDQKARNERLIGAGLASPQLRDGARRAAVTVQDRRSAVRALGTAFAGYQEAADCWATSPPPPRREDSRSPSPPVPWRGSPSRLGRPGSASPPRPDGVWDLPAPAVRSPNGGERKRSARRRRTQQVSPEDSPAALLRRWARSPYGLSTAGRRRRSRSPHSPWSGAVLTGPQPRVELV